MRLTNEIKELIKKVNASTRPGAPLLELEKNYVYGSGKGDGVLYQAYTDFFILTLDGGSWHYDLPPEVKKLKLCGGGDVTILTNKLQTLFVKMGKESKVSFPSLEEVGLILDITGIDAPRLGSIDEWRWNQPTGVPSRLAAIRKDREIDFESIALRRGWSVDTKWVEIFPEKPVYLAEKKMKIWDMSNDSCGCPDFQFYVKNYKIKHQLFDFGSVHEYWKSGVWDSDEIYEGNKTIYFPEDEWTADEVFDRYVERSKFGICRANIGSKKSSVSANRIWDRTIRFEMRKGTTEKQISAAIRDYMSVLYKDQPDIRMEATFTYHYVGYEEKKVWCSEHENEGSAVFKIVPLRDKKGLTT